MMDSIISAALVEICRQGVNGVSITELWPRLHNSLSSAGLQLCNGVKRAIWNGLVQIPGLQFQLQNPSPLIPSFENAEELGLKIVAPQHLRDSFVGIYDLKASDAVFSDNQRRALDRLAVAGDNGITQSQLAKEFHMEGNNIFYVVRKLECQGLIVRQSTVVRTKEAGESATPTPIVNTNLMHLSRYAKHLGCQQKIEITKADTLEENLANADGSNSIGDAGEYVKDDVRVKDYLPALKAVCDLLEKADKKALVVSDIKQTLGYRMTTGHRAWRNVYSRLKEAGLVEKVLTKDVNKKVVNCIRLRKSFDPKHFQPKTCASGSDDFNTDQTVICGTRGQITEQLLELPIEHQIYDLVASEGSKGIFVTEVWKRLGLNSKKYYPRLTNMISRFGLQTDKETLKRSVLYRLWTPGNFNAGSSTTISINPAYIVDDGNISTQGVTDIVLHERSDPSVLQLDVLASEEDSTTPGKFESGRSQLELCKSPLGHGEKNQMNSCGRILQDIVRDTGGAFNDAALDLLRTVTEPNAVPSETTPPASLKPSKPSKPSKPRSYLQYPCLTLTASSVQREQRILQRLQEEKFILVVELYRWLQSLEKDKLTKTARKTVIRTLSKLQREEQCKCVDVIVPAVTNTEHTRKTEVVLHKSYLNPPPEFLGQVHEKLRDFDMQSRGKGLSRSKIDESVPVLSGITRTLNPVSLDCQATRAEAMRVNGFVLAKMVRAKLLHNFLWGYINSLPDWNCALSSGRHGYDLKNPHSTCKLFVLGLSIKAMPVELFLQVVGSTQKLADLIESCKRGLHLSDLPVAQYKSLMDTRATGRLSRIIDILCRLKLIRLVTDGHEKDAGMIPRATTLTHAMELKPYIEEPLSRVPRSLGVNFLDLRPRVRHDFILSNREAVDLYWKTLEYSYAQAESTSAVHAFPGSSVPEVYYFKSWSSTRVMTAEQRALLLKRVVTDDPDRKISFAECVNIAKDLNLTLEQVLRVSYDNRSSRLQRFQKDFNPSEPTSQSLRSKYRSTSRKRKKNSKTSPSKRIKAVILESDTQKISTLSETDGQYTEESNLFTSHTESKSMHLQASEEARYARTTKESGQNEENEEEGYDFISQCALSRLKTTRRSKFSWTESLERQLVIQYVRHRAALGAKFHRIDWGCLPDLPAPPSTCRRRMALLNNNQSVRKQVMKLCNLLGKRYVNHLHKFQEKKLLNLDNSGQIIQDSSVKEPAAMNLTSCLGKNLESDLQDQRWDDFDDMNIKMALDEVLRRNRVAKLETSRKAKSVNTNLNSQACDSQELDAGPSTTTGKETQNNYGRRQRRSRCQPISEKFLKRLREGTSVSRRAYKSLAVANAVELLKLIFLNTSTAPEVPNLLAKTLRRYSEHDLFAAFNYLREKKYMIGGNGNQFILSQKFLHSVSSSPFPSNTGKRAAKFARWLCEREKDLMEEGIHLNEDLQCGDIFYLLALVSTGEIFISPCLPDEGIGEAEEKRSTKHRTDEDEPCSGEQVKKPIYFFMNDGEFISRRAKGFPGIKVSLSRTTISRADAVELSKNEDIGTSSSLIDENDQTIFSTLGITGSLSLTDHMKPCNNSSSNAPISGIADESPWKTMTRYAECLMSSPSDEEQVGPLKPDLFKTVHSTIRKSGDQGLSMGEVSQIIEMQGKKIAELVIDVLQAFGLAVKVNAYDSVHIVDASFCSKYFLSSMEGRYQDLNPSQQMKSSKLSDNNDVTPLQENPENAESSMDLDAVHKVTLLNLPEEGYQLTDVPQLPKDNARCEDYMPVEDVSLEGNRQSEISQCMIPGDSHSFRPILPWINGDGTTNLIIYKGLTRRVLGIVMQSPGILEGDIFDRINVLNPQSCKKLLELMVLDNHLIVRKMYQTISSGPPSLLGSLFGSGFKKPEPIFREHYFANQMSVSFL